MTDQQRMNQVTIVVGRRGAGKTTFVLKIVKSKRYDKVLIIDTLDHPSYRAYQIIQPDMLPRWKKGIKRLLVNEDNFDELMQTVKEHVHGALVLFEDAGKYIIEKVPPNLRQFVLDTKQTDVDAIFLYHGFGDVVPRLFRYADNLTMCKTNDVLKSYKYKIPNYNAVELAFNAVMASDNPYHNITIKLS